MSVTVVMLPPPGQFPTLVHLPDGSVGKMIVDPVTKVTQFEIPAKFIGVLLGAGWSVVQTS
ncbi:hypothetical protein [Bradyrhizobium jicamae]|uniref:hypothetical protein n=1 Tax=Bradyrhizobium jicamae TaxID=280332 RepID=UPI001BACDB91|nr:hypothetical protein [Bradyrhizobium jicamae]MBR0937305.1 hypothetical protein [Bradyrhizobium jicamae]